MKTPVLILARVSTSRQDFAYQLTDLENYCEQMNYEVVHTIKSIVTGNTTNKKRDDIQELLTLAKSKTFEKVVITEISRLGRRPKEIRSILDTLHSYDIAVVFRQLGVESLDENGNEGLISRLIVSIHSELALNERELLSQRVRSGLEHARRQGKQIGRPKGSGLSNVDLLNKYKKLVVDLADGLSLRKCEKIHGLTRTTIIKVKRAYEAA